jgi:hypothetical protein
VANARNCHDAKASDAANLVIWGKPIGIGTTHAGAL